MSKVVTKQFLVPFILITSCFALWGFANDITNPMVKAFSKIFRMSVTEGALVQLAFYGGSFTAIPVESQIALLEAANEYLDSGEVDTIRLSTRPDAIDGAVLRRLEKYRVGTVEIGAQSMDDDVLRLSGRGHTADDVVNAARSIRAAGFRLIIQMMTGLPGDSGEQSIKTAEMIAGLHPDGVRIYPTVIIRDTALYDLWKSGRYMEHTVEEAVEVCSAIVPVFENAGIPIIRLGLNPTDELSAGSAVGGAYHPALGELVRSRIYRGRAEKLLEETGASGSVQLEVHPSDVSKMTGQHRENLAYLKNRFGLEEIKVRAADCPPGSINISTVQ